MADNVFRNGKAFDSVLSMPPQVIRQAISDAKAIFTAEAEHDLGQIVDYIAQDNKLAAVSWLQETRAVCDLLAVQPGIGQRVQTNRSGGVRRHVIGNYVIYYQPSDVGIDVVRILHGAREQGRLI